MEGLGRATRDWLTTDWVLSLFSPRLEEARRLFDEFVHDEHGDEALGTCFHRGGNLNQQVIGDDRFLEQVFERTVGQVQTSSRSLDEVVASICEAHSIDEAELKDGTRVRRYAKIRAEITNKAIDMGVVTLSQVARRFDRSDAVLCRSMRRYFGSGQAFK